MTKPVDDDLARRLLASCAQRDERALAELHRLLAPRIHAFVLHRMSDEEAAQTVVVDTLFEVWKSAAKFRGDSKVTTWVLGIARYRMMASWRQAGPVHEDIVDHEDDLPADIDGGPEALDRWQQARIVHGCLGGLSAAQRECLQLVYFEGLGLADVAAVQDVPVNTVKTRLFHARRNLRACVEKHGGGCT